MKILVISNMYPSKKDPAYGTFVRNFYEDLNKRNASGYNEIICIKGRTKSKFLKILKYVSFYTETLFKLLVNKYDIVYVHTITFPILPIKAVSILKKLPLVFNTHGTDVLTRGGISSKLKQIASSLLPSSLLIVVPSEYFKKIVLSEFHTIDENQIYISPSAGIRKSFYNDNQNRHTNSTFHIGFVSRIDSGKGWDTMIRAVNKLKKEGITIKVTIAGGGSQETQLINKINEEKLDDIIDYIGPIDQERLPELYLSFDVFIFPTILPESLGLVGIEAMAAGVPIICSDIGALSTYVIDGYNGFKIQPGNYLELADTIKKYITLSATEKDMLRKGAYEMSKGYNAEKVNKQLFDKLTSLLKKNEKTLGRDF